jgi:TetR/AcrR family transcriptional repressor of nem operon
MGRVSNARENLIEAVMELIWTGSYGSTSVEQICDRAGVKKGSFYYFFESKTALAVAAIDHSWAEFSKELDGIFSPAVSPLDRIINCSHYLRREQEDLLKLHGRVLGCPIHSLGAEISTVDLQLRDRLQEVLSHFISYYEMAIRDGQSEGTIVSGDPRLLANLSFSFCEGQLLHARMQNDLSPLDDVEAGLRHILAIARLADLAPA